MKPRGNVLGTIVGAAAVGGLVWVATRLGGDATWRYWAVLGILAGGGLALALAERWGYGGPGRGSAIGFLLGFVPALVCSAWIAIAGEPHSNWFHDHVVSWSGDLGIRSLVTDLTGFTTVIAFALGALVASMPVMARREKAATAASKADDPSRAPTVERRSQVAVH